MTLKAAARIDALAARIARYYRHLPTEKRAAAFREMLARNSLPGGLRKPGNASRTLAETFTSQQESTE